MNNMKRLAALMALVAGVSARGFGLEVVNKDNMSLDMGGRLQIWGVGQIVKDPVRNDGRVYLFIKQSRLMFTGRYEDYKYRVELAFAGEEDVKDKNASLSLLEFSFDVPFGESAFLKVGQFKVPYGRERIVSSGEMQFADSSIQSLAFKMGYDAGAVLHGYRGKTAAAFGVFTGGGRDVPERYLPERLGFPVVVLRAGLNDGLDKDIFNLTQSDFEADRVKTALFVNGLYIKDTLIGHSTVLNVKTSEKSLMINPNWNPFIGRTPLDKGDLWQAGLDAAVRAPLGGFVFSGEAEGNYAEFSNVYGTLVLSGGRVQIGLYKKPVEIAVRYAFIVPDGKPAYYDSTAKKSYPITGSKTIQEITPALTYHLRGLQKAKIILDAPILVNVPVAVEKGIGAYVLTEQPDQTSYAKSGGIKRRTVVEARILLQLGF